MGAKLSFTLRYAIQGQILYHILLLLASGLCPDSPLRTVSDSYLTRYKNVVSKCQRRFYCLGASGENSDQLKEKEKNDLAAQVRRPSRRAGTRRLYQLASGCLYQLLADYSHSRIDNISFSASEEAGLFEYDKCASRFWNVALNRLAFLLAFSILLGRQETVRRRAHALTTRWIYFVLIRVVFLYFRQINKGKKILKFWFHGFFKLFFAKRMLEEVRKELKAIDWFRI